MDDKELDYLLARGRLSGAEKERVLDAVQAATRDEQRAARPSAFAFARRPWVWALAGVCAIALLYPVLKETEQPAEQTAFLAKGGQGQPTIEAGCAGGCRPGSTLLFQVSGVPQRAFLASFAEDRTHKRIWHFPSDTGEMPAVAPSEKPVVLKRGIRLGAEHPPGSYRVHLLLTRKKMSRDEILQADKQAESSAILAKTVQELKVSP